MKRPVSLFWFLTLFILVGKLRAESPSDKPALKTAIFMANRADKSFDEKLDTLEDFVTGPIAEKGYSLIGREVVADAVTGLRKDNQKTPLDDLFGKSSAPLRLAQMLQADYLMLVSVSSFGTTENKIVIGGKEITQTIYTLRATYKLNEGILGATVKSAAVSSTETIFTTPGKETVDTDLINRLLEKAAKEVASKIPPAPSPPSGPTPVSFTIIGGIMEAGGQSISLPDIRLTENRTVVIEKMPVEVQAVNATVEFNGAAIGSTPDQFKALPGLHKIKLTHEQCEPWERTINISAGQTQKVVLQMTDKAYQRWKDQTAFLQTLENGKKLTDAEAERIKGLAEMFRKSHVAVDVKKDLKEDIKVDTKEGLKVYKSIY